MSWRAHYFLAQVLIRSFAYLVFGYKTHGTENIPRQGPFLVAANHKSYFDPPFIGCGLRRQLHYFAKKQLFQIPLFSGLIRSFGAIPVDREGADRRAVSEALAILERGEGLLVFPEGTRIRRMGLGEAKAGIGLIAIRSGAPVVPAFIASSWEPRRRLLRRIAVQIHYGPPVRFAPSIPGTAARERYAEAAQAIMGAIRALAPPGFGSSSSPEDGRPTKNPH